MKINTDTVSRLLVGALMMYAPFTWLFSYDSVAAQMEYIQPDRGAPLIIAMALISLAIFFDVFLNSMFNFRWKWIWATRHRDSFYILGSFCSVTVLFSVGKYLSLTSGAAYLYIILFMSCAALALIDSYAKRPCNHSKLERRKFIRESK